MFAALGCAQGEPERGMNVPLSVMNYAVLKGAVTF